MKLLGFSPAFGLPDASPFVVKVDAYLRMTGLEYEYEGGMQNLKKAPKGKLPLLEDDDKIIADSQFIIEYLKTAKGADLDTWLADEERAISHLVTKSLDENLYFCLVHSRWVNEYTWPTVKANLFSEMPFPLKHIVPAILRHGVISAQRKQGMGRHSNEELLTIANHSFQSMSALLGDQRYFFGDQPSTLDAAAYGHLAAFISVSLDNEFNAKAREYENLVAYCRNIEQQYY